MNVRDNPPQAPVSTYFNPKSPPDINLSPTPSVTRLRYAGCKLETVDKSGQPLLFEQYGWDGKSEMTIDGSPVVEVTYTSPTTLLVDGGGDLQAE